MQQQQGGDVTQSAGIQWVVDAVKSNESNAQKFVAGTVWHNPDLKLTYRVVRGTWMGPNGWPVLRLQPLGDGFTEDDQFVTPMHAAVNDLVAGSPDE